MTRARLWIAVTVGAAVSAAAVLALADPPKAGWAADPTAIANKKQWVFDVVAKNGKVSITKATEITLAKPAETPRQTGRFAIELWIGKELIDRARFNVPLLGDEPPEKSPKHPFPRPDTQNVTTHIRVQMADSDRTRYLELVDRLTGDVTKLAWPPEADGHLVPWAPATFSSASAWPPPGAPPSASPDAGAPSLPKDAGPG